ncbi:MAG: paraquat-inducible protein A [Spongiibacteraceae bacterium]|nr:paraquat-inducible protein A [Spongiibacteraceae bacterium]
MVTAQQRQFFLCHTCHRLQSSTGAQHQHCQRCGDALHYRHRDSIAKTWALCITSAIFFVFANIFPIMTVIYLGKGNPDTIISGVILLAEHGMIPIALVVFIASVVVPLLKLTALFWLLLAVQLRWKMDARQRTQMYRLVKFVGRWSMLDLFVIAILVTLVDLGGIATITGGPGATYFSTVVVLTMFAAHTFDPRLIWDLHNTDSVEESPQE